MRMVPRIAHVGLSMVVATGLLGQSGMIRPVPNWRLGDKRQVDVEVKTRIDVDTFKLRSSSSVTYQLEVISARKDGYELAIRSGGMEMPTMELANGHTAAMDSVNQILGTLLRAMCEPLSQFEFHYRVDRHGIVSGLITGKDDRRKLIEAMAQEGEHAMEVLSQTLKEPPQPIPPGAFVHVMDSLYDAFVEVQVNGMNYFLKIYATEFPLSGSLRQPVLVEDLQAPLHTEFPRIPGVLEVGLDKNDDVELVGRTITTYDPDALFAYMQEQHNADNEQRDGLFMNEECVEHFDKRSGWLTSSSSSTRMRIGTLKMNMTVSTQLKPIS